MTEERRVVKIYESFVLGFCKCRCGTEINIRRTDGFLKIFSHGHNTTGKYNPNWNGGIGKWGDYLYIIRKHHKYASSDGRVALHRYRMELILGRYLTKTEVVHHIDGNKYNCEEDNLMLFSSNGEHISCTTIIHNGNTRCLLCGSNKTTYKFTKKGLKWYNWYSYESGHICNSCYYLKNKEKYMERQRIYRARKKKLRKNFQI